MPDPAENRPPRVPGSPDGTTDRPVNYTCGFCACVNTRRGEVLQMSTKAREYRDQEDKIATLASDIAKKDQEVANLRGQLEVAAEELAAARRGQRFSVVNSGRI